MSKMAVDPKSIDIIVISHDHWDHYGSIVRLLEFKPSIPVYMPSGSWKNVQELIRIFKGKVIPVTKPVEIVKGAYITGNFEDKTQEQTLTLAAENGALMLSGCAHPGIQNLVKLAAKEINKPIKLVAGGFLMKNISGAEIRDGILQMKSAGVVKVAPSHCTSDSAMYILKEEFSDGFIRSGTGKVITSDDLN